MQICSLLPCCQTRYPNALQWQLAMKPSAHWNGSQWFTAAAWDCRVGGVEEWADRQDGGRLAGARRPVEQQVRQLVLGNKALDCIHPQHAFPCDQRRRYRALGCYYHSMRSNPTYKS